MLRREIKKLHDGLEPRRLARNSAVKAHRHHPRMTCAFRMEHAQRRREMIIEIVRRAEFGGGESIVVVRKTVGNDEMRPLADFDPIGPVIGITIRIVEEATMLDEKRAGVSAGRVAALPAERMSSDRPFEAGNGACDDGSFLFFGQQKMLDETVAMATKVEAKLLDRFRHLRIARKRLGARVNGDRYTAFPKKIENPQKPDRGAVFEQRFGDEIAGARKHFLSNAVGQRGFRSIVTVGDQRFCTLLDIENDHER